MGRTIGRFPMTFLLCIQNAEYGLVVEREGAEQAPGGVGEIKPIRENL